MSSDGTPTADEYNVIWAVEQFYKENKYFPGTKTVAELTTLPQDDVSVILDSSIVKKYFESLGIDSNAVPLAKRGELKRNQTRLTDKQLAVAEVILNPMDKRNHTAKLNSLGVNPTTYQGWTSNKTFSDYMRKRAEDMFGEAMPLAQEALVRKVMRGDMGAIKLYMEMTGKYNKNQIESGRDFKMLVWKLIEVLQKHIKDPALLQMISTEIKELVEPTRPVAITQGEIVYGNDPTVIT